MDHMHEFHYQHYNTTYNHTLHYPCNYHMKLYQILIFNNNNSINIPLHWTPFPMNPLWQEQLNPPSKLLQSASISQLWVPTIHSFTSNIIIIHINNKSNNENKVICITCAIGVIAVTRETSASVWTNSVITSCTNATIMIQSTFIDI